MERYVLVDLKISLARGNKISFPLNLKLQCLNP